MYPLPLFRNPGLGACLLYSSLHLAPIDFHSFPDVLAPPTPSLQRARPCRKCARRLILIAHVCVRAVLIIQINGTSRQWRVVVVVGGVGGVNISRLGCCLDPPPTPAPH